MSRKTKVLIGVLVAGFAIAYLGAIVWLVKSSFRDNISIGSEGLVAVIRINGVISASGDGAIASGETSPENIIKDIQEAEDDDEVKAILLRINSPGGTAGSSEEIYSAIKQIKKPVVASISDIGASGAYWIASGADKIIANASSEVGSIGVIIAIPNLQKLFNKLGVDLQVISQGKYKDLGNPARPLTSEEKKILKDHSFIIYNKFVDDVAKSRNIPRSKVLKIANGLTYPGSVAKELKLIDGIGNYSDSLNLAAKMGKIKGKPETIEYEEPGIFDFFGNIFGAKPNISDYLRQTDFLNKQFINERPLPR